MRVPYIRPMVVEVKNISGIINSKDFKTLKEVLLKKPIGEAAADVDAWWRAEFREAKLIETQIREGKYKYETPDIYRDNGGLNFDYFRSKDDDGFI